MEPATYSDDVLEAYLRHELPADAIAALEEQLLRDEELFQRLETVEMNLIDRYLENEMTDTEKQSFESGFLNEPDNAWKLKEARVFRESLALRRKKAPGQNVVQFPFVFQRVFQSVRVQQITAAAVVLIVLAVIVVLIVVRSRESRLPDKNISSMSTKVGPTATPAPTVLPHEEPSLPPGKRTRIKEQWLYLREARSAVMGPGEELRVTVPPDTEVLRFRYELMDDAGSKDVLRITIKDRRDYPIFPSPGTIDVKPTSLRHRGIARRAISVDVPMSSLKFGEHYRFEIADPYTAKTFRIERGKE
jgi:hypothetical protein